MLKLIKTNLKILHVNAKLIKKKYENIINFIGKNIKMYNLDLFFYYF